MQLSHQVYYGAALRHASYYMTILRSVKERIEQEPLTMRQVFTENLSQIQQARAWLIQHHMTEPEAAHLLIQYALCGSSALAAWSTQEEQIEWLQDGIRAAERVNNLLDLARLLNELSECYIVHRSLEAAFDAAQQALTAAQQVNLPELEADALVRMGRAHIVLHRDEPHRATDALNRAAALYAELGLVEKQSWSLHNLGSLLEIRGDLPGAREILEQAIELIEPLPVSKQKTVSLARLGAVLEQLGDLEAARHHIEQALQIARQFHNNILLINVLMRMSDLINTIENHPISNPYMDEALEIARRVGATTFIASITYNQGTSWMLHGEFQQAVIHFQEAAGLYRSMDYAFKLTDVLIGLSMCHIMQSQYDIALSYLSEVKQIPPDDLGEQGLILMFVFLKLLSENDEAPFVTAWKHLRGTDATKYYRIESEWLEGEFKSRELEAVDPPMTYENVVKLVMESL